MSNFKVEFTLKQHTPIIHFQSDQSGATLRATELKPKLDKFLFKHVQDLPFRKNANGEKSLDYKVKIIAIDNKIDAIERTNPRDDKPIPDPLFFGNMNVEEKKKSAFAKELKIEFISFVPKVTEAIQTHFEAFMAQTNFGTRQSKGYGSFYLDKPFNKSLIPHKVYSFNTPSWKEDIKLLYSFLRQGINYPKGRDLPSRFYTKPAIFTYAVKNNWTWDKKAVKRHFFLSELQTQQKKYDASSPVNFQGGETYLLRDLFGLSSDQKWGNPYSVNIKKEDTQSDSKKKIERFKSPITFKIIGNQVFFWANDSVETMLNKTFKISTKGNKPLELQTPKEFSFDDFFAYVQTIDLAKHIDGKFHQEKEFSMLNRMLTGIKASK